MKVAAADVKHNYRIQAASPGLAMLTAVDGSPDDRPVEVAIGTELPGYGKVREHRTARPSLGGEGRSRLD